MLEETKSLIDIDNNGNANTINKNNKHNENNDNTKDETKIKNGFISTMKYYLRIPTRYDWIMTGLFISGIIVTIILVI